MLEKTGKLLLTQDDIDKANNDEVSIRIKQNWGLSLEELLDIIRTYQYELIPDSSSKT